MTSKNKGTITIVGAGLGGAFLAYVMAQRGFKVSVYEKYSESQTLDNSSNRSFNITFYGYGVDALKAAGLWEKVEPILLPLKGSATQVTAHGDFIFSRFEKGDMDYYAVKRAGLLQILVAAARSLPNVTFHFETEITAINRDAKTVTVQNSKTKKNKTFKTDIVLGADGAHSIVRDILQEGQKPNHSKVYADWTYRQIAFDKSMAKKLGFKPQTAYSWTRKYASLIGFPQIDNVFGALLMLPKDKGRGFADIKTKADALKLVKEEFPTLEPAWNSIVGDIMNNPEGGFVTILTSPWYYRDFLAIVGDAAHGFYPFYGQGAATAFGDCMKLVELIDAHGTDWGRIFPLYEAARKPNTDVIGELSRQTLQRFTRSTKADPSAIYDKLEQVLHGVFPKYILPPMFNLVAHDPNNASTFLKKHDKQRKIFKAIGVSIAVAGVAAAVKLQERSKHN